MKKDRVAIGAKLAALLLTVGGAIGVAIGFWAELANFRSSQMFFFIPITLLFAWSVWVGVNFWYGKASGYRWAKILFAMQIPIVSIPGFTYQFYEGLQFSLSFSPAGESKVNFGLKLASLLAVGVLSQPETVVLGINLVAIGALIYLIKKSPQKAALAAAAAGG